MSPIPICGIPLVVRPRVEMPINLLWRHDLGINWVAGEPVTIAQLERAIAESSDQRLPNDLLPSLCPGDVVLLEEGRFWLTRDWQVAPLPERSQG